MSIVKWCCDNGLKKISSNGERKHVPTKKCAIIESKSSDDITDIIPLLFDSVDSITRFQDTNIYKITYSGYKDIDANTFKSFREITNYSQIMLANMVTHHPEDLSVCTWCLYPAKNPFIGIILDTESMNVRTFSTIETGNEKIVKVATTKELMMAMYENLVKFNVNVCYDNEWQHILNSIPEEMLNKISPDCTDNVSLSKIVNATYPHFISTNLSNAVNHLCDTKIVAIPDKSVTPEGVYNTCIYEHVLSCVAAVNEIYAGMADALQYISTTFNINYGDIGNLSNAETVIFEFFPDLLLGTKKESRIESKPPLTIFKDMYVYSMTQLMIDSMIQGNHPQTVKIGTILKENNCFGMPWIVPEIYYNSKMFPKPIEMPECNYYNSSCFMSKQLIPKYESPCQIDYIVPLEGESFIIYLRKFNKFYYTGINIATVHRFPFSKRMTETVLKAVIDKQPPEAIKNVIDSTSPIVQELAMVKDGKVLLADSSRVLPESVQEKGVKISPLYEQILSKLISSLPREIF